MCCLLIVWLALVSVGANAHTTSDAAHEAFCTHDMPQQPTTPAQHMQASQVNQASQATENHVVVLDTVTTGDASHADICNQSQCGHGQTAGMLTRSDRGINPGAAARLSASCTPWASSLLASTIERPKWAVTTHAVVNLLS